MAYRIVVPVKQVPDMERVRFDTVAGRVDRSSAAGVVNPADLHALEVGLRIRDTHGGTVTTISMGPRQAESALKECLARGADRAVLLADKAFAGSDTWATSHTLAAAVKRLGGCDLVICGEKTVDGDTGQVGPEMAEWLNIPHVSYVTEVLELNGRLKALCEMNDGLHVAEAQLPALISVTRRAHRPRYARPRRIFEVAQLDVERWGAEELKDVACIDYFGVKGSPTHVTKIVVPPVEGRKGRRLIGSPDEAVASLVHELTTGGII